MWLVSANYHNNLGYLLSYFLAGMMLAAPFDTRRQLREINWRIEAPAPVFAGEMAELAVWLENSGPPRWQVKVTAPGAETVKLVLDAG